MPRLYVGNLADDVSEDDLKKLFDESQLDINGILMKKSFAFVDVPTQEVQDRAVDKLNGADFFEKKLSVEPSLNRRRRSNRLQLKSKTESLKEHYDHIVELANTFGTVQNCEVKGDTIEIAFETPDQAKLCLREMSSQFSAVKLEVEYANLRRPTQRHIHKIPMTNQARTMYAGLPLRLLVPAETVGAVIGSGGENIQKITQKSHARVDVRREFLPGNYQTRSKMVCIFGSVDRMMDAAKDIMEIVWSEMDKKPETSVGRSGAGGTSGNKFRIRLLMSNQYCGRLIGRQGATVQQVAVLA